jgi:hypothetical protein
MNLLLLSIAMAFPTVAQQENQPPRTKYDEKMPMQKLDGEWTVTYAELDGKKMQGSGFTQVAIKNNIVTCRHDGKEKSWRLQFGPHNMVRCTEIVDGKTTTGSAEDKRDPGEKGYHTHHGVYIASPEYFCLSVNKGQDRRSSGTTDRREGERREGESGANQAGAGQRFGDQGAYGGHFVLILHRSGNPSTSSSRE